MKQKTKKNLNFWSIILITKDNIQNNIRKVVWINLMHNYIQMNVIRIRVNKINHNNKIIIMLNNNNFNKKICMICIKQNLNKRDQNI